MIRNIQAIFKIIKELNAILTKQNKRYLMRIVVVVIISAGFELLGVTAILPFIQTMLTPEEIMNNEWAKPVLEVLNIQSSLQLIVWIGIGLIFIYLLKNAYMLYSYYVQYDFSTCVQKELSVRMLRSYMDHPYTFFLKTNSAEILRGCSTDIEGVFYVISHLYTILAEVVAVFMIGIFIILTEPWIAIGLGFLMLLVMLGITLFFKPMMKRLGKKNMEAQAEKNKAIYQSINGIKEILVMQRKELFIEEYDRASDGVRITRRNYELISSSPERIIEGICVSGLIGIVLLRLLTGVEMLEFIPKLGAFAMASFKILPSIGKITSRMTGIVYFAPALDNVYHNIWEAEQNIGVERKKARKNVDHSIFEKELQIKNVKWKYEEQEKAVLMNVSINICKGESIALIGQSGSGKTTLSDIILGLLSPQSGGVYIDGKDVFSMPEKWASMVGYVPQSFFLMDDTIRNNIAFGLQEIDDSKVWEALQKAQLKSFVEQLPDGLDTIVGERGVKFSGGQRQRIAIARALFNEPQILVLDEATAALDNDTESAVMEAIDALQGQITLIIVAHRLSTIRSCDKIYEIKDGQAYLRNKEEVLKKV